jgi:hypothetical protein
VPRRRRSPPGRLRLRRRSCRRRSRAYRALPGPGGSRAPPAAAAARPGAAGGQRPAGRPGRRGRTVPSPRPGARVGDPARRLQLRQPGALPDCSAAGGGCALAKRIAVRAAGPPRARPCRPRRRRPGLAGPLGLVCAGAAAGRPAAPDPGVEGPVTSGGLCVAGRSAGRRGPAGLQPAAALARARRRPAGGPVDGWPGGGRRPAGPGASTRPAVLVPAAAGQPPIAGTAARRAGAARAGRGHDLLRRLHPSPPRHPGRPADRIRVGDPPDGRRPQRPGPSRRRRGRRTAAGRLGRARAVAGHPRPAGRGRRGPAGIGRLRGRGRASSPRSPRPARGSSATSATPGC